MAKINKYLGFVFVGAATAAAAGAIAASVLKRKSHTSSIGYDEIFEEDFDDGFEVCESCCEERAEDFMAWEETEADDILYEPETEELSDDEDMEIVEGEIIEDEMIEDEIIEDLLDTEDPDENISEDIPEEEIPEEKNK